jgi:electron transfer flavoprotein beta subunit
VTLRIVICAKEVLDPDAVNNYALEGRLVIGEDGRTLTQTTIPRLMNAYDEQAIEAALRLRDAGVACAIAVVSAGPDPAEILRHAAALGADEIAALPLDLAATDHHGVARALAAYVRSRGGADLVLCGRQASDDDQGVVPALVGEILGMPVVTVARSLELLEAAGGPEGAGGSQGAGAPDGAGAPAVRVVRVTPDGDETVEVACPAVVTVSNELGQPRYPTMAGRMAARRKRPAVIAIEELGLGPDDLSPRVSLARRFVPAVTGACELIAGDGPAAAAERLVARLRADGLLPGGAP